MDNLSENWISEGWIDFEYKKYLLLAYLKNVDEKFREVKLYPPLADLIKHYEKLTYFDKNRNQIRQSFPKEMKGVDFEKLKIKYKEKVKEDELMTALSEIVDYSLPKIKGQIEEGKSIYDFIENQLEIVPVGLTPIYQKEGYAFFTIKNTKEVHIYRYTINIFQNSVDKFRGIALKFIEAVRTSIFNTCDTIKMDLIKKFKDLPNPSAWRIHSHQMVPLEESILPISKRLLLQHVVIQ